MINKYFDSDQMKTNKTKYTNAQSIKLKTYKCNSTALTVL